MEPCKFCGYDPEVAHAIEDMTEEEKRAARFFFPGMSDEEAEKHFLYHRSGCYADEMSEECGITAPYNPKQFLLPWNTYGTFPGEWYGQLWWKGREEGVPDPTVARKEPWYKRWFKW